MRQIFIAGDSTASIKEWDCYPETGWGEAFRFFLKKNCFLYNYAKNARSTKSFREEGIFDEILSRLNEGDFVLIQFGHNDGKKDDPNRYTEPFGSYQENLRSYIADVRSKGAIPILLTSVSRRQFDDNGRIEANTIWDYPEAMLQVARETNCEWVDSYQASVDLLNSYGLVDSLMLYMHLKPGEHMNYPNGLEDDTHFSPLGAMEIAQSIAKLLLQTSVEPFLNRELLTE